MLFFSLRERSSILGKNLKGKDCGKGIYQRKDGLYSARFVDKTGKRHEKYFQTIPEAKTGLKKQNMRTSTMMFLSQPTQL